MGSPNITLACDALDIQPSTLAMYEANLYYDVITNPFLKKTSNNIDAYLEMILNNLMTFW